MALQENGRLNSAAGNSTLPIRTSEIDTVISTLQRASGVFDRVNELADRLAGSAPTADEGSSCQAAQGPGFVGIIPSLARAATVIDGEMDRVVESLNRIERLI